MSLAVNVKNLVKFYGEHQIIKDLSIDIDSGSRVVFQGPSGIGKSTFLRCLTGLETFQNGTVEAGKIILRADMTEQTDPEMIRQMRMQMGYVFQFFNLFPHLTILENIILAPTLIQKISKEQAVSDAENLLKKLDLISKINKYPHELSGGQAQRVGIARALAMRPQVMLFDEPTSSLDPEMKKELVHVIEKFEVGLTMLIVTHEPYFVEGIATRIIKFGSGLVIEEDIKK
jgi:ABC-type polar amino acid transport system ATPase subunit